MTTARVRLAVDIGGTFTDVVLEHEGGRVTAKVLTTAADPALGFMAGVEEVLAASGTAPEGVGLIIHGTTLATNALIERTGARTALITTEGHRDALEMAHENRYDQYDLDADRPPPLVPRALRWPVRERLDWQGRVLTPLDQASVEALLPRIEAMAVESIAIGLLHAYANPAHEQRIRDHIARAHPSLSISLASEVCPEIREYERQSTTCANAYLQPAIARYLGAVARALEQRGLRCPCLLMTSGGHLVTIETATRFPVRLIESGPAGGAILASHIARQLGLDRVVSFDMGGTTAKICLIDDGQPLLSRSFEVARAHRFMKGSGLPVKIPVVELVEIGAGGGSIARIDDLGRIRVGPASAGAEPGPACYGRGGRRATVTDANLVLGRLDGEGFAGGRMRLDRPAAEAALSRDLPLAGQAPAELALGVIEIVDENMANAARVHAVERGKVIAERTMIAFGGAAPLHAARLAEKLDIARVIVPADASVGSAIGFLLAPVAYEVVRSRYMRLSAFDGAAVSEAFEAMRAEALAVVRQAEPDAELLEARHAYARYVGQGHEIEIALPDRALAAVDAATLRASFEAAYEHQYGRTVPGLDVEVLTFSLTLSVPAAPAQVVAEVAPCAVWRADDRRPVRFPGQDGPLPTARIERAALRPGAGVEQTALIAEAQTTTALPPGFGLRVNGRGDLVLQRQRAPAVGRLAEDLRRQVVWDRLIAVVEEQAQALIRTAFSTTVREAGDLSAGVFDLSGRMLAQAVTGTPGHVNAMAASVGFFLDRYPIPTMQPGDVFVTNDPWLGTGHLFDFTVLTPIFEGLRPVALFASTVHVVDIGGAGFGPDAGQVFEEGLCIPILPLFQAGVANDSLLEIVRANVREPVQVVGDLYSLAACNEVGGQRLLAMLHELGLADLEAFGDYIVATSKRAMLAQIRALPAGVYENAMTVDGYDAPVHLRARMTIAEDGIEVDYSGTSAMSAKGINVPYTYTAAYTSFGIRTLVGSRVPNNAGSLAPIRVIAPEGCILNAPRPAAVNVRHVTGQMLPDVVLGCLDQALPGSAPAEGSSSLWNPMLAGGHGIVDQAGSTATPFSVTIFHAGGTGARPGKDGLSATAYPSGVRNTPVEITEAIAPILYRRKEYREGSGGSGRHLGGEGQVIELAHAGGEAFAVFALFDRIDHPARGRHGGGDGAPGGIRLASGRALDGKGKQIIPPGDTLILELPGGGGLGEAT